MMSRWGSLEVRYSNLLLWCCRAAGVKAGIAPVRKGGHIPWMLRRFSPNGHPLHSAHDVIPALHQAFWCLGCCGFGNALQIQRLREIICAEEDTPVIMKHAHDAGPTLNPRFWVEGLGGFFFPAV